MRERPPAPGSGEGDLELTRDQVHRCAADAWPRFDRELSPKLFSMLLEAGANPNARNTYGNTPLDLAVSRFRNDSDSSTYLLGPIRLLLDAGADVNASNDDGSTALHHVFSDMYQNVSLMMAAMLIWRGARADVEDKSGMTPARAWSLEGGWRDAIREAALVEDENLDEWRDGRAGDSGVVNLSPLIADYYSLMVARSTVGRPKAVGANAGGRSAV